MSVLVKICGLNEADMLEVALQAGADFVGLVFYPRSPRNVSMDQAIKLVSQTDGRAKVVALTVDADDELLAEITEKVRPDYIQAHGDESPARISEITERFGIPVIKAMKVRGAAEIAGAADYEGKAALMLFDAAADMLPDALPGGNGVSFDWTLLHSYGRDHGFMLSGGLRPENVAEAIRVTGAPMVDVSSGVESRPGVKDAGRIRNFIEAAKAAG